MTYEVMLLEGDYKGFLVLSHCFLNTSELGYICPWCIRSVPAQNFDMVGLGHMC